MPYVTRVEISAEASKAVTAIVRLAAVPEIAELIVPLLRDQEVLIEAELLFNAPLARAQKLVADAVEEVAKVWETIRKAEKEEGAR